MVKPWKGYNCTYIDKEKPQTEPESVSPDLCITARSEAICLIADKANQNPAMPQGQQYKQNESANTCKRTQEFRRG